MEMKWVRMGKKQRLWDAREELRGVRLIQNADLALSFPSHNLFQGFLRDQLSSHGYSPHNGNTPQTGSTLLQGSNY